jgi:hypothetical protein
LRKIIPLFQDGTLLPMLESFFSWGVTSVVVALLIGAAFSVLALNDFKIARGFFLLAAFDALGGVAMWGTKSNLGLLSKGLIVFVGGGIVCVLLFLALTYIGTKESAAKPEPAKPEPTKSEATLLTPSLVFVFGTPLGDNDSASWVMMLKHYGPGPAYNCDIGFFDDDRKNIEHEWLVQHPDSPFPPPGLAGESQKHIHVAEASPEGEPGNFVWNPLNPNSQHYTVSISCRDGVFVEKWEVTRVNGILRSIITIEHGPAWIKKNPNLSPVVFRCEDPEFIRTSLATELPKSSPGKVVHPGWKPSHRFEVPAAIIDSNGNVQVLSGVKLPDGSTLTDFGCWNILVRHFGDKP